MFANILKHNNWTKEIILGFIVIVIYGRPERMIVFCNESQAGMYALYLTRIKVVTLQLSN